MRITTRAVYQMTDEGFELLERDSYEYAGAVAECKKDSEQTVTQETLVPDFLQPFVRQASSTGSGALSSLQQLLGGDLVADFNPVQQQAIQLAISRAGGAGGFLPTAQNTILNAARGQGIDSFLPSLATNEFGEAIDAQFLPAASRNALTDIGTGTTLPGTGTLQRTAAGDFLFGGEGFDQAVDAAVRAARPAILSTFGAAGPGAATGGLARAAIGQSAVDAFASQFANERRNQLSAADTLGRLRLAGQGQQLGAIGQLADINQGQDVLGLGAASNLAQLAQTERGRQLAAAGLLPELATADINLLSGAGQQLQGQEQREISAPITAQQALLQQALGIPGSLSPLFGQTQTTRAESNPLSQILGGALTAASIFGTGGLGGLFGLGGGLSGGLSGFGGFSGPALTTGQLLRTDNPLEFFGSDIGGFGV